MGFKIRVRSKHDSHIALREAMPVLPYKAMVRLGSTTDLGPGYIEVNSIQSIKNSADKSLMKACFDNLGVRTADWAKTYSVFGPEDYPLVAKHVRGSRGTGNYLIKTPERAKEWAKAKANLNDFIWERYHNFGREYRLYVTQDECYFAIRKLKKNGIEEKYKWRFRNEDTVWVGSHNPQFEQPSCWAEMVKHACLAAKATGLDIAAIDVKVQYEQPNGKKPKFIILETNSAFMLHTKDLAATIDIIPKIVKKKYEEAAH